MSVEIREALAVDADMIVELIADLGHSMPAELVRERVDGLRQSDCPQIVAAIGGRVIGLCGLHIMTAIHRQLYT